MLGHNFLKKQSPAFDLGENLGVEDEIKQNPANPAVILGFKSQSFNEFVKGVCIRVVVLIVILNGEELPKIRLVYHLNAFHIRLRIRVHF